MSTTTPGDVGDAELIERFRGYTIERDTRDYYRAWLDHEVRITRCGDCARWQQPSRSHCPACWSTNMVPTAVSGRGTVALVTLLHQGSPAPGVDYTAGPHPVVTVELEEQPHLRITSTVVDAAAQDIVVGAPVELTWLDRDGIPVPAFRLTTTSQEAMR